MEEDEPKPVLEAEVSQAWCLQTSGIAGKVRTYSTDENSSSSDGGTLVGETGQWVGGRKQKTFWKVLEYLLF